MCLIPQEGYREQQQALVHLCSDKGIQSIILPAQGKEEKDI